MAHTTTIEQDAAGSDQPARWTSTNIMIHWAIVALLAMQAVTQLGMGAFYRSMQEGVPAGGGPAALGIAHMIVGASIFVLMIWRLVDLQRYGRPPHPPGEPHWSTVLSTANHWAFYAILLGMPVAGALAFFLGIGWLAELHEISAYVLVVLIVLHLAGAVAHQVWFKTSALKRKMPGNGRAPADAPPVTHYRNA